MFQKTKLRNGKYFVGSFKKGFESRKGWFLGSFFDEGDLLKNDQIEMCYKDHVKGDRIEPHYHKRKVEVLIFLKGEARYTINGQEHIVRGGDFLFADVNNIIEGEFLKSSKIIAIHSPSLPKDKVAL
jgi:quercetin dioxygenase-like cupin family protein